MIFADRYAAGNVLATLMEKYKNNQDAVVIALPRGGVVVAYQIAKFLQLPLDVICPRKIGAPHNPELAIGAITETGEGVFNQDLIAQLNVTDSYLEGIIQKEKMNAQRRLKLFRQSRPPRNLKDKVVLIVDDGLATGATMKAAIQSVKAEGAKKIVVAVPVAPPDTIEEMKYIADEVICPSTPANFYAIGQFYEDFSQVEDNEVLKLLEQSE